MRDRSFGAIETTRLRLRLLSRATSGAFHAYRADDDIARYRSWHDYSLERAEAFVEEVTKADPCVPGEPFQFALARLDDDPLVGHCMLALDAGNPPLAELGYTIAPGHQRRGYSREAAEAMPAYAFERHSVAAVRAVTDTRNAPSIAVAQRLGMRLVGTVHTRFKGEPCDEHTNEITRDHERSGSARTA